MITATVVISVAAVTAAVLLALLSRPGGVPDRPQPLACPPVTSAMTADLDGDGCPSAVVWSNNVLEVEGRRYELGQPGDSVVLGDWDCDGRDTPALYRPDGAVFYFDSWAEDGRAVPAASQGEDAKNGVPQVLRGDDGCDRLVVR